MDDYLSKPVDRRLLESCLALWLQRSPRREGGGRRHRPEGVDLPAPAHSPPAGRPAADVVEATAAALAEAETLTPMPLARPMPAAAPMPARTPEPAPVAAAPAALPAAPPATSPTPVLDLEVVEELRAIMGPEYQGLIKMFFEDAPLHIQRLQAALAANDLQGLIAPAHTLKSSSANLGAQALSAVAKRIEHGARSNSLEKPAVAVMMLENEFRRAKAALMTLVEA